jgi:hypothetical protein
MGALGCSDGPGPSSVVCAKAAIDPTLASAKVKIANFDKTLDFIANPSDRSNRIIPSCIIRFQEISHLKKSNCRAKAKNRARYMSNVFNADERGMKRGKTKFSQIGRPQPEVVVFNQLPAGKP